MIDIIDDNIMLNVLQSMTRNRLAMADSANTFPLPNQSAEDFGKRRWNSLGVPKAMQLHLHGQLRDMFPPTAEVTEEEWMPGLFATPGALAAAVYADWAGGSRPVVYTSSGSTGTPKKLVQSYEAVMQEVDLVAGLFPDVREVVGVTPQHHCYGFTFGVLLHRRLKASYRVLPPFPTVLKHLECKRTLVVGYPGFWARVPELNFKVQDVITCLSAGARWADSSMEAMLKAGYSSLVDIYGSSENGAVGRRSGPGIFTLLDYWSRGEAGDVLVRRLPSGVRLECPAQDELDWNGLREFKPRKRLDKAVQVGGINVYPARVAGIIEEHPLVAHCRVRLMRPEEGDRLKAFIVPVPGADVQVLKGELQDMFRRRFTSLERPGKYTFGAAIPATTFGKETDW